MFTYECCTTIAEDGTIVMPADYAAHLPKGEPVRIVVFVNKHEMPKNEPADTGEAMRALEELVAQIKSIPSNPANIRPGNMARLAEHLAKVSRLDAEERLALIRSIALIDETPFLVEETLDERSQQMLAEQEAWFAQPKYEREPYRGQFVAIRDRKVIDHDLEQNALLLRVRTKFGEAPIPILSVDWDTTPEYIFHSPSFIE